MTIVPISSRFGCLEFADVRGKAPYSFATSFLIAGLIAPAASS